MSLTARTVSGTDPFRQDLCVLHVLQPTQAGVWEYATQMAGYQAQHGWRVHLAAPRPVTGAVAWHRWESVRSPVKGLISESRQLAAILREVQPDVVVAHSAKAGLIARATVRNALPIVYIPHAWSFQALSGPAALAARAWEKFAARWTNAVVCVSDREVQDGRSAMIRAPYFLLPNPVLPRWTQTHVQHRRASHPRADVVFVGRLSRQKGADVLLQAWPEVRRQVPAARLVMVGDGPDAPALRRSAGPGVTFAGIVSSPRHLVESARIAAQPSRWEGLSLSLLEAMWSGLSVVTTGVGGSELVAASRGGAVTPIGNPHALADAIIARLQDPALVDAEGRRNADYVRRFHDFDTAAQRLAAVIARTYAFGPPTRRAGPGRPSSITKESSTLEGVTADVHT